MEGLKKPSLPPVCRRRRHHRRSCSLGIEPIPLDRSAVQFYSFSVLVGFPSVIPVVVASESPLPGLPGYSRGGRFCEFFSFGSFLPFVRVHALDAALVVPRLFSFFLPDRKRSGKAQNSELS